MMHESVQAALLAGDVSGAVQAWKQLPTPKPDAVIEFASTLFHLYYFDEAQDVFLSLLENETSSKEQLLAVAKLWFGMGRYAVAARYTGKALEAGPADADLISMHASCLSRSGNDEVTIELLERALEAHPGHARNVRLLAHLKRTAGDLEGSRQLLEQCLSEYPSPDDWRLHYEHGYVLDRCGEYGQAISSLKNAKHQLTTEAQKHQQAWQLTSQRQWQCTQLLGKSRLEAWGRGNSEFQSVLMAGFPRSGTTLLETILSRHPRCVGTDETGILASQFRDPLIMQAPSAHAAIEELDSFEPEDLQIGRQEYLRCTEAYIGESVNGRILIEKEPLLTADLHVPLRLFPDCKILMPLRDPRDVVISFYFTIVPLAANSVAAHSLEDSCRYYAEVMRHWLYLREQLPQERWLEIRYEDLLSDPEAKTQELTSFLGIEWTADLLDSQKSSGKAVSTPTYSDVSKPLYQRSRERWRHYERELSPHLHLLEPYLEAFGYGELHSQTTE
ncbi:Sulfotransferase domain-containing protein [Rubritalea squalenifaciens DSM 18772]|uniref:Sulfotransferase domain-containing protein n=1 Tax=Rubritalea squalenifaciens DSM 18772 TaxID=1123071 RepID=A0A1M6BH20_9BACT|nr:sulfotransferase [Rubritalea squalenifaciens]SHI48009.1 Sulfotransferase domain-containing protein [Rubritalea squalenifaciens DSM 18772]